MTSKTLTYITAMTLLAALVTPLRLAAQVGGSGSTNYLPIWTNSTTLGDSKLFQTGGMVGIGTTSPAAMLAVIGPGGTIGTNGGNAPMRHSGTTSLNDGVVWITDICTGFRHGLRCF